MQGLNGLIVRSANPVAFSNSPCTVADFRNAQSCFTDSSVVHLASVSSCYLLFVPSGEEIWTNVMPGTTTANLFVLHLATKSGIESGYVRHETKFKIRSSVSPNAGDSLRTRRGWLRCF